MSACSHVWIDPTEPPIARAPYVPWIGERRREMKRGKTYVCRNCGALLPLAPAPAPVADRDRE